MVVITTEKIELYVAVALNCGALFRVARCVLRVRGVLGETL